MIKHALLCCVLVVAVCACATNDVTRSKITFNQLYARYCGPVLTTWQTGTAEQRLAIEHKRQLCIAADDAADVGDMVTAVAKLNEVK